MEDSEMKAADELPLPRSSAPAQEHAADLLELLYFVHDKGISAIADVMRGQLTRTQAGILWLIRSEGDGARSMLRKDIAHRLQIWFDLSSPAITNALQSMARPPLGLVRLVESVHSAREKRVFLTPKGERLLLAMAARGRAFVRELVEDLEQRLSEEEIVNGIEFLRQGVAAFGRIYPRRRSRIAKGPTRNGLRRA
jgi:DNA-binding MarR family transcriptional regulator